MVSRGRWFFWYLLTALAIMSTASCAGSVSSGPETTARVWLKAFIAGDSKRVSDLTCDTQLQVANLHAAGVLTGGALMAALETLGLVDNDSSFSTGAIGEKVKIDTSKLDFEQSEHSGQDDAIVHVRGHLRLRVAQAYFTKAVDSRWTMVRAGHQWQWCGLRP